jgi:hypothetical protein
MPIKDKKKEAKHKKKNSLNLFMSGLRQLLLFYRSKERRSKKIEATEGLEGAVVARQRQ